MSKKEQDRILQTPSEANRDKHVNFVAQEEGDTDPSTENTNSLYKKQKETKEEKIKRKDKKENK